MGKWMGENKKKIIGFLATITVTISLIILNKILLFFNPNSVASFIENDEVDKALMFMFFVDTLVTFLIGLSVIYFAFIALNFIFYKLKNRAVDRVGD